MFVSGQAERYGADRSLLSIAKGLILRGWEVTVSMPAGGPLADDLIGAGASIVMIDPGVFRRVNDAADWARLMARTLPAGARRVMAEARYHDLVHVNSLVIAGGLVGAVASGKPVVCHLRESFSGHRWQFSAYASLLKRLPVTIVAVSEAIAEEARSAGLGAKTVVVRNGIDFDDLHALPSGHERSRAVVSVGRINDWKGHDVLARAVSILRSRGIVVPVLVAGDVFPGGEHHRARLESLINTLHLDDQVKLLGFVDDVSPLLANHTIFVLASVRPEPFGLALVEAMAAGMACIATRAGGPREIIEDGVTGLLVEPGDPSALADAIGRLWRDDSLRKRLGEAALRRARELFGTEREVEAIESLYESLLERALRKRLRSRVAPGC